VFQQQTSKQRNVSRQNQFLGWVLLCLVTFLPTSPWLLLLVSNVQIGTADTWTTHPEERSSKFLRSVRTISLAYMVYQLRIPPFKFRQENIRLRAGLAQFLSEKCLELLVLKTVEYQSLGINYQS
jgi:hypothetical protein